MAASKLKFCQLVLIVAGFAATKAEVDCKMRPPHVDMKSCCDMSNFLSDEIKEKCEVEGPPGPPGDVPPGPPGGHGPHGHHHGGPHGHHPCLVACALNETGILIDDELQEDNLQTYLNGVFDDGDKVEFLMEKFKYCDEKRKNSGEKQHHGHGPPHHHHHNCGGPKHGKMLVGCVFMETFKECPDNAWSNTDECNEVRDHFTQCHPHFGPGEKPQEEDVEAI